MADQPKKRGPKPRFTEARKEYHFKLLPDLAKALEQVAGGNVQAYMEGVLRERNEIIEILSQQEGEAHE